MKAGGIAQRLDEEPDRARAGQLEREVEILVERDGELLSGRHREVEVDALLDVDDPAHAGTRLAEQRDVAAARMRARREAARPHAVVEVVEAHAVAAAEHESRRAHARADALAQRRIAVILQHERRHDRGRARAVRDRVLERRLDALVADGEDDVLDALRQRGQARIAAHAAHVLVTRVHGVERAARSRPAAGSAPCASRRRPRAAWRRRRRWNAAGAEDRGDAPWCQAGVCAPRRSSHQ